MRIVRIPAARNPHKTVVQAKPVDLSKARCASQKRPKKDVLRLTY